MNNCPICNRENETPRWCDECSHLWKVYNSYYPYVEPSLISVAKWAANRAREFEKEKIDSLLLKREDELQEASSVMLYERDLYRGLVEDKNELISVQEKKIKILVDGLEEIINMGHASDGEWSCEGYCHVEAAQEALEEYRKEN